MIATVEASMTHILAALDVLRRTRSAAIEVRPDAAAAFDADLRTALAGTVWHSGCTNWYVDAAGNDPSQWPWSWSEYRRRTRTLDPGAYSFS